MVKFGIIGAGRMGNTHASYLGTYDGAKIVAVYDPKPEAAQAMHDKYGAEICSGPEACGRADCVVVSPPPTAIRTAFARFSRRERGFSRKTPLPRFQPG